MYYLLFFDKKNITLAWHILLSLLVMPSFCWHYSFVLVMFTLLIFSVFHCLYHFQYASGVTSQWTHTNWVGGFCQLIRICTKHIITFRTHWRIHFKLQVLYTCITVIHGYVARIALAQRETCHYRSFLWCHIQKGTFPQWSEDGGYLWWSSSLGWNCSLGLTRIMTRVSTGVAYFTYFTLNAVFL